ncbi:hypothetical protein CPAV1605_592 [seawater metagenome]|uniref:Uncharacterized protein n=1 Tax=seawater metagenome TaxID=1561972 RepID=A0A5E8CIG7_9ZZZZ
MSKFLKKVDDFFIKKKNKITKILDPKIHYLIRYDKENYNLILILDKKTNKLLFTAKYQYLGIFNNKTKTFHWAHTLVKDKRLIKESMLIQKKLKDKDLGFKVTDTSFKIKNENLELLIKVILYLTKSIWYFQLNINQELVQFISIEDILEKYI